MHWLHGKIWLPSSTTAPLTPFELFYSCTPNLSSLRPFSCLTYIHLQKDQFPPLLPHATQCVLIGYPMDYKGWRFWDPWTHKEIISNSAVFRESVFPFHKPGLSGVDKSVDPVLPAVTATPVAPESPVIPFPAIPAGPLVPPTLLPAPVPKPAVDPLGNGQPDPVLQLITHVPVPPPPLCNLPECPCTPPTTRQLTSHFEHHLHSGPHFRPSMPPGPSCLVPWPRLIQPGLLMALLFH